MTVESEIRLASSENDDADAFLRECKARTAEVRHAIRSQTPVVPIIENSKDFIYLKAVDGTIIVNNSAYERIFIGATSPTGRRSDAFLNETLSTVSKHSDALIAAGADELTFWHPAQNLKGDAISFRTFKASLLGLGDPRKAILGISRMQTIDINHDSLKILPLSRSWELFSGLKDRDQQIAASIAQGERTKAIAEKLGISEKTVENTRNAIMSKMSLENQAELIKLMVRLQDSGFCDFGL